MEPTKQDELFACLTQLNTDITTIIDVMEYMQEVQQRFETLITYFDGGKIRHEINEH